MNLKLKFWGSKEAVEQFKKFLDENFIAAIAPTRPSDQGDYHAFATLTLVEMEVLE